MVGGGVAAAACAEALVAAPGGGPAGGVAVVAPGGVVRRARRGVQLTEHLAEVSVEEAEAGSWAHLGITVVPGAAEALDLAGRRVRVRGGGGGDAAQWLRFRKLCVCTGAAPKALRASPAGGQRSVEVRHPAVFTLRDTESAEQFVGRALGTSAAEGPRRVLVVGNGGVALEAAWGLARAAKVIWAFPHAGPGDAYFDLDAAEFLAGTVKSGRFALVSEAPPLGAARGFDNPAAATGATGADHPRGKGVFGPALGPEWLATLKNILGERESCPGGLLEVRAGCELSELRDGDTGAVTATLTSGERLVVDVVLNATGVVPNTAWLEGQVELAADGGVLVDSRMESSSPGVFAAGDVCTVREGSMPPGHWFQMRLWGQAETMGVRAAHCMGLSVQEAQRALDTSMAFEIFTHATRFFGMRVVLLGRYNGQGLEAEPESDLVSYSRVLERGGTRPPSCGCRGRAPRKGAEDGPSFVRVLLLRGRMQGAVLIGESDLEETFENLILNGLDLSSYGPAILDPEVDLEAYFD